MDSFWNRLPKPFFAMAPMADVTDPAFRRLVARLGKPDVMWTEFVSADGLCHTREIKKIPDNENPLLRDLQFTEAERPIVAQIFSSKPKMIAYAAKLVAELGFDGVDLNMGCPDRSVEKQGAGAALIKNPALAVELIKAAQNSGLPVSVKTRIGYNAENLEEWLTALLETKPAAVTLHLRTRKHMSKVPADWEQMKKVIALRNRISPETILIGNGDVMNLKEGKKLAADTLCDGIMIGRGVFGNPWVFQESLVQTRSGQVNCPDQVWTTERGVNEKLVALVALAHDFEKLSPPKHFAILKKHIKAFVTGFDGAAALREKLMEANTADELEATTHALVPKA